ncbi:GNAT family N-acetyltransferase [Solirubrobacter phytolaccae]|uniref:GNAT family N-acetyltransferase n=1 Tax=Solirubrobacter phytolaccae TaxID=1404360 RepID=A0A9X3N609_9ACTN|nr:GNAT family N-acetyltransferase [Solirubrobacter phytolaccae]MDA0178929.1 GNAT family N-acetyltransferase [Solirubrobacter phytolaccae]
MDSLTSRVRTAHGDAWQVHGALRAGAEERPGIRLMASGLGHPQWNNADITAPDADMDAAAAWYATRGVPWGMRVPRELEWSRGSMLFYKRLMGLEPAAFVPPPAADVRVADDLDTVVTIDAAAFGTDPAGAWLTAQFDAPRFETALGYLDGEPVATGYSVRSDGRAGPCLYVAGVGVLPHARRRGLGAALTAWLIARGFEQGATLAHLHPDDDGAARLYERLGFVEVPGFNVFVNQ